MKNKFYDVEQQIELCYVKLANLEVDDPNNEYQYYFHLLFNLINEEKRLLLNCKEKDIKLMRKELMKIPNEKTYFTFEENSYQMRLLNLLNLSIGDDLLEYANNLIYDINQIIFSFIDILIVDDNYCFIKKDLIMWKYYLIFMNINSEDDFLNDSKNRINFESLNFNKLDIPSLEYVDKVILTLDIKNKIEIINDLFLDLNEKNYPYYIANIIELLAKLTMCNKEIYDEINFSLNSLLEQDLIQDDAKEILNKLIDILEMLQPEIKRALIR